MADASRISRLSLKRFRGATTTTQVEFDASKSFTLLYGENGSGKSTIVDAIDFVANENLGAVREISSAGAMHVPAIGAATEEVQVSAVIGGKTWNAMLRGTKVCVSPRGVPSITILRRSRILALATATPAKRYEELKQFIDVDNVQKSEVVLDAALKKACVAVIDSKVEALLNAQESLRRLYQENKHPSEEGLDAVEWARQRIARTESDVADTLGRYDVVINAEQRARLLCEQRDSRQQDLDAMRMRRDAVKDKILKDAAMEGETGVLLVALLGKAQEYLSQKTDCGQCPVCEQSVDGGRLSAEITERLEQMAAWQALARELDGAARAVKAAELSMKKLYQEYLQAVYDLLVALDGLEVCKQEKPPCRDTYPTLMQWNGTLTKENIAAANQYMADSEAYRSRIRAAREALQAQQAQQGAIRRNFEICEAYVSELKGLNRLQERLEAMLAVMRRERLAFTQKILDDVANDCERIYARIHPDEDIGKVRFLLDENKRASLNQSGSFRGHADIVPQGYFSESHLDTLGFALFMALTKKASAGNTTVVFDDVFTSVDQGHIERLLHVLCEESRQYNQLIVTTHQPYWLHCIEANTALRNSIDTIRLKPWTLETGAQVAATGFAGSQDGGK